jgi:cystinosin
VLAFIHNYGPTTDVKRRWDCLLTFQVSHINWALFYTLRSYLKYESSYDNVLFLVALNVVGFTCYSIYVCALYFSSTVQGLYHEKYGPNAHISVQSNDVAFAVHALILSTCTLGQIAYYDGLMQAHGPSQSIFYTVLVLLTLMILSPVLVALSANGLLPWRLTWLDYLYVLSFLKIGVSLIKYIPQVVLNYHRKSTLGWSE